MVITFPDFHQSRVMKINLINVKGESDTSHIMRLKSHIFSTFLPLGRTMNLRASENLFGNFTTYGLLIIFKKVLGKTGLEEN